LIIFYSIHNNKIKIIIIAIHADLIYQQIKHSMIKQNMNMHTNVKQQTQNNHNINRVNYILDLQEKDLCNKKLNNN
jgi:hypothetical protein